MGSRLDRSIFSIVEDHIDTRLETPAGELFSRTEVMRRLRAKIGSLGRQRRAAALRRYRTGNVDRRAFLKLLGLGIGGAAVTASGAGYFLREQMFDTDGAKTQTGYAATTGTDSRVEEHASNFGRVINLNDEAGLGEGSDVASVIDQQAGDDRLLVIEPGTYQVESNQLHLRGMRNLGIVGKGDTTFMLPDGQVHRMLLHLEGQDNVYENINWDWNDPTTMPNMNVQTGGRIDLRAIVFKGEQRLTDGTGWFYGQFEQDTGMVLGCNNADAEINVEYYKWQPKSYLGAYGASTGILICCGRPGKYLLKDLHLEDFASTGLYCSRINGQLHVEGGLYRNNSTASLRINSDGSYVDGAFFEVDLSKSGSPNSDFSGQPVGREGVKNIPPIKVENNTNVAPYGHPEIRNTHVRVVQNNGLSSSVIPGGVYTSGGHPGFTIEDSYIEMNIDGPPAVQGGFVKASGVHVTGEGAGPGIMAGNTSDSYVRDCCISRPGNKTNIPGAEVSSGPCDSPKRCETWGPLE